MELAAAAEDRWPVQGSLPAGLHKKPMHLRGSYAPVTQVLLEANPHAGHPVNIRELLPFDWWDRLPGCQLPHAALHGPPVEPSEANSRAQHRRGHRHTTSSHKHLGGRCAAQLGGCSHTMGVPPLCCCCHQPAPPPSHLAPCGTTCGPQQLVPHSLPSLICYPIMGVLVAQGGPGRPPAPDLPAAFCAPHTMV
jgi:hypothetical protein